MANRPGDGPLEVRQRAVFVNGVINSNYAKMLMNASSTKGPTPTLPATKDNTGKIVVDEIVYTPKYHEKKKNTQQIPIMSSVNGKGAEALRLFPNDPEMVSEAILADIHVLGTSNGTAVANGGTNDVGVQIAGVQNTRATTDIQQGSMLEFYVPSAEEMQTINQSFSFGEFTGKHTIQVRPYQPRVAAEYLLSNIQACLYDRNQWQKVMSVNHREANAMFATVFYFAKFCKLAGIAWANYFAPFIAETYFREGYIQARDEVEGAFPDPKFVEAAALKAKISESVPERLLLIASRMQLLDPSVDATPTPKGFIQVKDFNLEDCNLTEEQVLILTTQFVQSVFWRESEGNLAIGFDSKQPMRGVDETGKLLKSTKEGNMISQQINTQRQFISGVMHLVQTSFERNAGFAMYSAHRGQTFARWTG